MLDHGAAVVLQHGREVFDKALGLGAGQVLARNETCS